MTREIVARPPGAGLDTFAWRVSIAEVSADGPFSVFEGVDRVLVLLEGNGVTLRGPDGRLLRRIDESFVPFAFGGDDPITSSLLAGPCIDFNVMTRRSAASAEVRVVRADDTLELRDAGVLFAAHGRWTVRVTDCNSFRLDAGDGCWWEAHAEHRAPRQLHVEPNSPDGVLLVAGISVASTGQETS